MPLIFILLTTCNYKVSKHKRLFLYNFLFWNKSVLKLYVPKVTSTWFLTPIIYRKPLNFYFFKITIKLFIICVVLVWIVTRFLFFKKQALNETSKVIKVQILYIFNPKNVKIWIWTICTIFPRHYFSNRGIKT